MRVWNSGSATATSGTASAGGGNYGITFVYTQGLTVVTAASLPDAGEGTSYNQLIQADWGVPAYSWTMPSGSLPNGVTLTASGNDYLLSGTPTVGSGGTYNFTVEVTDSDSTPVVNTKAMTLFVDGLKVVNANPLADGRETVAYNETFTATNGPTPYTWSMISGTLPAGLSLAQVGQNYQLTGTSPVGSTGSYTFELQVVDNNSSVGTKTFDLYIDWAPGALTYPLTEQDPSTTGFTSSTSTSARQYGYQFTCNSGGVTVYRLGSNMPAASAGIAKTVSLFDAATSNLLGQVTTGPGTGWQWTDLASPILLQNGSDYIVCVHTTNGWYQDTTAQASWRPTGDIQFVGGRYIATSSANSFPTTLYTGTQQYGVADIGYAKGLTITTDAQLPSGAEGTSYNTTIVAGFGTPAYSWQNLSGTGALPSGLSL
ncbi:MAG: putative Ig domain-containing protein, partial [Planctomycetes bacterium]|nr:putative Ig domain-containing protein [Planctomycetota bacterium]